MMQPSRTSHGISRRRFLILSTLGAGLGAGLLTACGAQPAAPAVKPTEAAKPTDAAKPAAPAAAPTQAAPAVAAAPQPTPKPVVTAAAAPPPSQPTPAPAAAADKPVKKGGILKMGINQESATVDPHKSRDIAGTQIKGLVYSQLIKYYKGRTLVPDLAEKYETVDETTYVFTLKKGVKFHDGADLTSGDVKASYDRILDPATGAVVYPYLKNIQSVTPKDDLTIEFKLKSPQATFLAAMGLTGNYIAQKKKIEANVNFEEDMVGTGPYKFKSRTIQVESQVEKNPNYFVPDRPYLDGVILRPIFDDAARMNALYSGDVDIVTYVNWAAMGQVESNPKYVLQSNKEDGFVMIEFRVDQPPFDNVKLRQAISYGIDRDAIIKTAASGRGKACYGGIIPSWMWGYSKELEDTYKYNPEKAKQLVQEAGAAGKKIELTTWPPDTELFGRPSVIVSNQLKQIGLEITLRPQATAEWSATRASGAYQMFTDGNLYSLPDPDFLSEYVGTGGRIPNANKFSDKEIDGWLDEARKVNDQAKRIPLYTNVQKKMLDLVPIAFLFYREQGEATQADVKGYEYLGSQGANGMLLETWLDR
jgi:peptide/nickel transport system substrate-binding protein